NKYRSIGEDTARHIEQKLELGINSLDAVSIMKRTEVLTAQLGNGKSRTYRMVPPRSLDDLSARLDDRLPWRPCPHHQCSVKAFYAVVDTLEMSELLKGDLVFVDPGDTQLQDQKLFVVQPKKWKTRAALVMLAMKRPGGRWRFVHTRRVLRGEDDAYDLPNVRLIGRVIHVVRDL